MTNRRNFIKTSAGIVAASMVMPAYSFAPKRQVAANDRIRVGLIGCRNMGWGDLADMLLNPEVECIALCDVDTNILGNRAAELKKSHDRSLQIFHDYRRLLEIKDIDAVIIGSPDHWHCLQFVDACSAGKDVYVEKPIANSIAECEAMTRAAKRYKRIVSVGQQQRSGDHWHSMVKYIKSGMLGRIARADVWGNFRYGALSKAVPNEPVPEGVDYDMWLGPAPLSPFNKQRFHGSWRMFWSYGGGLMTDWGVHLLDMVLWGMNISRMPRRVTAIGGKFAYPENAPETFDTQQVIYELDDFIMTWSHTGGTETGPYGRNYGMAFKGTKGTLVADRENWEVFPEPSGGDNVEKVEPVKEFSDHKERHRHLADFVSCIKSRNPITACTIDHGSLSARYAHLGNIAARTQSMLVYDEDAQMFVNNPEADALLKPNYRSPWQFPVV
ncbi:MAG: Gfo/Idh/MocA family oxidoreductase [Tannerellaceae bacterium]|jgi:predicted dehydrogenase|nr:Gfo/Idh/MocA family oxidoreductase [Tannerellaceae bacterium]